ncbi:MAG TPA: MaoC/PaaZ C-terminal domain-containing protein [Anaeromyxobacteraceae bacterium]|nr:MaoC/PaaZ C-terminal domain-containing protein [Anaeromyxobacteraceae bacterium]
MVLLARQLYFEAVKVGDELPPLVKPPVDRVQIARYAGASGDYGPLHVDELFARNAGFPSVLVQGMLAMGFLGELAVEWLRGARLRRFTSRFVKIIWPGDVITSRGRVADRRFEEGGRYVVDIELWAENQRGELVVRGVLSAQLYYNADDEARQRAGQPPLVVTQAEEEERLARLTRGSAPARPAVPARPASPLPARPGIAPAPRPGAPAPRQAPPASPAPAKPAPRATVPKPPAKKPRPKKAATKKGAMKKAAKKKAAKKAPPRKPPKQGGKGARTKKR